MIESITLATTAAVISAMVDVIQLGRDSFQNYFKRRQNDPSLKVKNLRLQKYFLLFHKRRSRLS